MNQKKLVFTTDFSTVVEKINKLNPVTYGPTRNYIDGNVSQLSPYISRGVISTKFVYNQLLNRGFKPGPILKFIQELAWRDYWQQIWIAKVEGINKELKHIQKPIVSLGISVNILKAKLGIDSIDNAILNFYKTGYMHNHVRMYIASIACNIGQNHWKHPAQWMYYYLLDADWASNALSWQWVAGANSNKKYYANQENINTFCYSDQVNTFLDVDYNEFEKLPIPEILLQTEIVELTTPLPKGDELNINKELPTLIYNFYNLDPLWKNNISANRILLLEPSHFKTYPISKKTIDFVIALSENIDNVQIYVGEFQDLISKYTPNQIYFKEHPLNKNYKGIEEPRDWMFSVKGYYPSFFAFWKKCKKEIIF